MLTAIAAVAANLPALLQLGFNVYDFIAGARQRLSETSGLPAADLVAANMAVDQLEAQVNARVDVIGKLAPNS